MAHEAPAKSKMRIMDTQRTTEEEEKGKQQKTSIFFTLPINRSALNTNQSKQEAKQTKPTCDTTSQPKNKNENKKIQRKHNKQNKLTTNNKNI